MVEVVRDTDVMCFVWSTHITCSIVAVQYYMVHTSDYYLMCVCFFLPSCLEGKYCGVPCTHPATIQCNGALAATSDQKFLQPVLATVYPAAARVEPFPCRMHNSCVHCHLQPLTSWTLHENLSSPYQYCHCHSRYPSATECLVISVHEEAMTKDSCSSIKLLWPCVQDG